MLVTVASAAGLIAYRGGGSTAERAAISIVILSCTVCPLADAVRNTEIRLPNIQTYPEDLRYNETLGEALADGIAAALCEKFGIEDENIRVAVRGFEPESVTVERVTVILRGKALLTRVEDVKRYVKEIMSTEEDICVVEIEL